MMPYTDLRAKIITACRIMDGMGLTEGFGHMSARLPDGEHILITPAVAPGMAQADHLLTFHQSGARIDTDSTQPMRAALETPMHLAIYRARPDVGAICRTHSRYAVILGAANHPLRTSHGFGGMLGSAIPVHPESDLIVDAAMGDALAATLGTGAALLLRGNGALAVGQDVEQAVIHAIYLEEAALVGVLAANAGGAVPFSKDELQRRARWYTNETARAWAYYSYKFSQQLG